MCRSTWIKLTKQQKRRCHLKKKDSTMNLICEMFAQRLEYHQGWIQKLWGSKLRFTISGGSTIVDRWAERFLPFSRIQGRLKPLEFQQVRTYWPQYCRIPFRIIPEKSYRFWRSLLSKTVKGRCSDHSLIRTDFLSPLIETKSN